jgi:phenylalanyl-tRNA synthetase beta chain
VRAARVRDISRLPQSRRDVALLFDRGCAAGELLEAVRQSGGPHLVSAELFDRYEGKGVPDGRVSLGFRLVFQRDDRTLTDDEVTHATERVVRMLTSRFGGEPR